MRDLLGRSARSFLRSSVFMCWLSAAACGGEDASKLGPDFVQADDADASSAPMDASSSKPRDASIDASKLDYAGDASAITLHDGGGSVRTDGGVDAGSSLPPFPTNGMPITAQDKKWTYIQFTDTFCRDGSNAGLAVSLNSSSKKVMIFLEGGGACFDLQTCLANPANTQGQQAEKTVGVFDRSNAQNPVKDWNWVYIPYCSGDTHAGANPNGNVDGVGPQKFVGYTNMQKFLNRIVPSFPDATDVVLTGISAGGFGAAQTAILVQRAFSELKVRVVDDSGPPMPASAMPSCLQDSLRTHWNLDATLLADCGSSCPNKSEFAEDYGVFLAKSFDNRASGLIETVNDAVISGFFGIGQNNCSGVLLLTPIPGDTFQAGLLDFRDKVKPYSQFSTYFAAGNQHTWLTSDSFYTGSVGNTKLVDWVTKIVNNEVPGHVGP